LALYLYWREIKKNKEVTRSLWLPTLWIMRCGSRTIDYWLGVENGGRMDPIFVFVLIVLGLIALSKRPCHWGGVIAHNSWLFIFYAYLAASLIWVQSLDNPFIKIFRPLGDLIMALVVATEPNPGKAIGTLFRRCAYLLIPMSIVLIRYYPEMGTMQSKHWGDDMWIGVTTHKNPLGQLCLVSAFGFFWWLAEKKREGLPLKKERLAWIYLFLTAYLLTGGFGASPQKSSTSIICLFLVVSLYLVLGRYRERPWMVTRSLIGAVICIGILSVILQFFGTSLQGVVAATQGKDATLTDRTYLWQDVIRIGMRHPFLGSGYGGFWVESIYSELSPQADNHPEEAHNGYLETFANLGFVGVGLLIMLLLQSLRSAMISMQDDFEYGRIRLVLLIMALVMNYSEATFTVGTHLWWFGFLAVAVYARPWVAWPEPVQAPVSLPDRHEQITGEEEAVIA